MGSRPGLSYNSRSDRVYYEVIERQSVSAQVRSADVQDSGPRGGKKQETVCELKSLRRDQWMDGGSGM